MLTIDEEDVAMANPSLGTPEQLRDTNYTPPLAQAVPLGIQHVLAMFVSNITPAIIVCGAAGFGFGSDSPDFPQMIYMIQMSMFFAGVATLIQTVGIGPIGARMPIVQGTSFAFIPIMIPLVAGRGVEAMAVLMGGIVVGGLFHASLGLVIGRLRFALPPLVTGLVVMMIGLALVRVGIQYAAGGVPAIGTEEYGSLRNWTVAGVVILVTLGHEVLRPRDALGFGGADRPSGWVCRRLRDGDGGFLGCRASRDRRAADPFISGSSSRSPPSWASA
jgi:xanthine/uracil permease